MPKNLKRYVGRGDLHFITFCCYERRPLLASLRARNAAVKILGEVRNRYGFALLGYVIMPEHVHLLVSEPPSGTPSDVLHDLKLRTARLLRKDPGSNGEPRAPTVLNRGDRSRGGGRVACDQRPESATNSCLSGGRCSRARTQV